ncbi:hypothetical protein GLOIN_2v1786555 [Rhizophagus irregularis DAOM 181602=DAOM 197198]|uniref:Uncharacterized protein n=1 Tax=Rhizophagus irregularis (strain DAOM 197198w) TaxID=1432141 RepID=A0A015M9A3_RHIIW|nr:hypothetical protein RirG_152320 [Rhizophagus irregularis DAOM 197198w]GBC17085.1 hypothetical protein GLOIN_2v1786555 [Rhizophagus irregularis DAOM 181602=DAOM 197198]
MHGQTKIEQLSTFFSLRHISFGSIVDIHLHPKQMKFLSKRISNYTVFSSDLDTSKQILSSGGVSLFIDNSLACHVQDFKSHSSRLLSVDLYFKGNVKLRIQSPLVITNLFVPKTCYSELSFTEPIFL